MPSVTQDFFNIATLVGTILSLTGVLITLAQIRKTLNAARAAEHAAANTYQAITRNVFLSDVSACVTSIEELKVLLRSSRFEAALLRVTDLNADLIHIQHLPSVPTDTSAIQFTDILTQLSVLREVLEQKVQGDPSDLNSVKANSVLSKISDQLNHWIGDTKYTPTVASEAKLPSGPRRRK